MLRIFAGFLLISSLVYYGTREDSSRSRRATEETNEQFCKKYAGVGDQLRFCAKLSLEKAMEYEKTCSNKEPRRFRNNVKITELCCTNTCTERQIKCFICDE